MHILWHKANMRITQKKGANMRMLKFHLMIEWASIFLNKKEISLRLFFWTKRQELCRSIKTIENYLQEMLAQQDAKGLPKANQPTRRG